MSQDFKFEEENNLPRSNRTAGKKSGMTKWLQSKGIAKSEKTAQVILLLVMLVCFGTAWVLLANTFGGSSSGNNENQQLTEEELIREIENSDLPINMKERRIERIKNQFE